MMARHPGILLAFLPKATQHLRSVIRGEFDREDSVMGPIGILNRLDARRALSVD